MAKKASPEVQYKTLATAMGRLDRDQQLRWLIDFLGQYDKTSVLIGGVLDALEGYYKEQHPDPMTYSVNGTLMSTQAVMLMAYGFGGPKTIEEAVELLWDQDFKVLTLQELDNEKQNAQAFDPQV